MALTDVEAIHVATVFDDAVDQLAILGRIMPASFDSRVDRNEIVGDGIDAIVDNQKQLESQFEQVLDRKQQILGDTRSVQDRRREAHEKVKGAGADLSNITHMFARSLRQNPLTTDNLQKVQADRAFLERVLQGTLSELSNQGSFQTLVEAVRNERDKKARLQETIHKEEQGRKRVRALQRQLLEVKREKEVEVQQRNEMIAHLKDQLQEMKAKTNMEGKYMKKCADVGVSQTQKRCSVSEKEMKDEIDELKRKTDEEERVNAEIESFLRTHTERLQKMVEHWMEKYEADVDQKQKELDILKASKAKDLERLQELTRLYAEYEQVVVEDRVEKEKARRKAEQEAMELRAAIKVQAWWRGIMVRKGLGAYSKKKKKKGKKGKKSGKGKKKKK